MFLNQVKKIKTNGALVFCAALLQGCSQSGSGSGNDSGGSAGGSNALLGGQAATTVQSPNFRLNMTDAPNGAFQSIKVNIESIEVVLTNGSKIAPKIAPKIAIVPLTKGAGIVDLLGLQNGVSMTMGDLQIPKGVKMTELRVRLAKGGHEGLRANGHKCKLLVGCGNASTVYSIKLDQEMEFDDENHSSLMVDFDAHQSIHDDDDQSESCGFTPAIVIKSAGKWKPENKEDDDFDSKGRALNNLPVVKDHKKKFEKHHNLNRGENGESKDEGQASNNQCVSIMAPEAVAAPPVVVAPVAVPGFFGAL